MWNEASIKEFWRNNKSSFAGDENAREIYRLTRRYAFGTVLDVGAGSGALLSLIPDCVGIDIVPRHPKVIEASACSLPFPAKSFDTVYASDILEHLTDEMLEQSMVEVERVLKPHGRFIAVVPYKEILEQSFVYCPNCKARFHRWGHVQVFDEGAVRRMVGRLHVRKIVVLPLSLMAKSQLVHRFWRVFVGLNLIKVTDILVVAEK